MLIHILYETSKAENFLSFAKGCVNYFAWPCFFRINFKTFYIFCVVCFFCFFGYLREGFMRVIRLGLRAVCQDSQAPKFFPPPMVLNQCLGHKNLL